MTVPEAAASLGVSEQRVRAMIDAKRLYAVKHGPAWWIEPADLERVRDRKPGRPAKVK